jgi:hypothetical protein
MPFIGVETLPSSMIIRGRTGRPVYCGWAWCGWSQCGEESDHWGTYAQRRTQGKNRNLFYAPYWPLNPKTENQQVCQNNFANAVAAWQGLTEEEKEYYNKLVIKRSRYGYHYFISKFLKS